MQIVAKLFTERPGPERSLNKIDSILRHLRFLKRQNSNTRMLIYVNSTFVSIPAHTVIFREGEVGDKMYIILKGKVKVTQRMRLYPEITQYLSMRTDGDHFGELALIQMDDDSQKQIVPANVTLGRNGVQQDRRRATCTTIEKTEMLAIQYDVAQEILKQGTAEKSRKSVSISGVDSIAADLK